MAQADVWSHETVLPPLASSAHEARDFVCLHLIEHELLYLVEDIWLVASEFATIAMVSVDTPFTLALQRIDESIRLTVTEGSQSVSVRPSASTLEMGRQGLSVVEVVSQDWGMDAGPGGGRRMWASFALRTRFL